MPPSTLRAALAKWRLRVVVRPPDWGRYLRHPSASASPDSAVPADWSNRSAANAQLVIAIEVTDTGEREVLGFDVGTSEDGAFWTDFLRSLKARGLRGVRLVVSDAHAGLRQAIAEVLTGATWQRCKVQGARTAQTC